MLLTLLPLLAALVAFTFATQLARQFLARGQPFALSWAFALALFGLASAAVAAGTLVGWSRPLFALYWLAGALLNVPLLAVGQLQLADQRNADRWGSIGVLIAITAAVATMTASMDVGVLAEASARRGIPLGREVLGGTFAYALVRPLNATFLVVVAGATWSAVRTRRWGLLLIALGVLIVAAGSSAVGAGRELWFSILLTAGIAVMYLGFRAAGPRRRAQVTVYTREGCHLCGQAIADVRRLARGRADVQVVDVDGDPVLAERYGVRVPVVAVNGREVAELQVDRAQVRAALRSTT